jgi:hypothetical protein
MSFNIGEHRFSQIATYWQTREKHDNYAVVSLSTSRKDKEGNWFNSNWGFVRFVGKAVNGLDELEPKDRIEIVSGMISSEPYMKDGEKAYPKTPQIVVFAWKRYVRSEEGGNDTPPVVEDSEDSNEELPF